jgi:hypothetical protein
MLVMEDMKMRKTMWMAVVAAGVLIGGTGYATAQDSSPKQDIKDAGHDTKTAAKKTGSAVAHGTKTAAVKTKEGTETAAKKTGEGTKTVAKKTASGTKTAASKTKAGTKKVIHGTAKGTEKTADKVEDKSKPN